MVNLGEMHMARSNQGRVQSQASGSKDSATHAPKFGLFVSTALASMVLASCAASAPAAEASFAKAQSALEDGRGDRAVVHAEAAVLAEPRNAGYRAVLGAAYLEEGRFQSAATAFGEAIELGDSDSRTILSYALAKIATGDNGAALSKLAQHEASIPAADYGLALALAGQPQQGVHHLINSVRNGENSAKSRQNLAYAYALAGNWRAARVMAAEDVPADQLDARLSDWAATARPEDYQVRVASLLGVSAVNDAGLPQHLTLANYPSQQMMVAEAEAASTAPSESEALAFGAPEGAPVEVVEPSVETVDPTPAASPVRVAANTPAPAPVAVAPRSNTPRIAGAPTRAPRPATTTATVTSSAPAPVAAPAAAPAPVAMPAVAAASSGGAPRFVSRAVVQDVPAASAETRTPRRDARPAPQAAPRPTQQSRMAVATGSADTHLVQLGSFSTRAVAESKWSEFKRRFPQLANHDVVITEARVNGRTFFRVAAAGFGRRSAASMCNSVKSRGAGCFAYAAASPPAGAVNRGVRIAARTR